MDEKVLPVLISILVIVGIAVVNQYSQTIAAVTTTMPTKLPLALWIIYAAEQGSRSKMTAFSGGLLISMIPTVMFMVAAYFAARAGWSIFGIIGAGYGTWMTTLIIVLGIRQLF